ncbi:hypothetical protein BN1013_02132 [Candidatus Rubidus massiliensis]|nr:hypothetical protein BN1013_02132 [Candidatus Rubidus massiliensis]
MDYQVIKVLPSHLTKSYCDATGYSISQIDKKLEKLSLENFQNLQQIKSPSLSDKICKSITDLNTSSFYVDLAFLEACENNKFLALHILKSPKLHTCILRYSLAKFKETDAKFAEQLLNEVQFENKRQTRILVKDMSVKDILNYPGMQDSDSDEWGAGGWWS